MLQTTLSKKVLEKYLNPYFVETGTSDGSGVSLALQFEFKKIFSVELDEPLQKQNIDKFTNEINSKKLSLIIGDSLFELCNIINDLDERTTFWLDAHVDFGPKGLKKCPLYEELECIAKSDIKNHTILIDDMRILGSHWGEGIYLDELKKIILNINPEYKFKFEDGFVPNDILVAYV